MNDTMKSLKKTFLPPYKTGDIPVVAPTALLLIGIVASVLILNNTTTLQSNASAINSVEPETGTLAGNTTIVEDSSASGGLYVRLGDVPPPNTPTPTPSGPQLYLSTTGSDSNACTQTAPCKTFARANTLATAGTTIRVAPGTYSELVRLTKSGTATAPIRYVSDTKWGAKISASSGDTVYLTGHYTDFEGFDITGNSSTESILELQGNYTRAIGNYVHNLPIGCGGRNGGAGINATGWQNSGYNGHHQEIIDNVVKDVGIGPRDGSCSLVHGIYAAVPYVKIANNIVTRSTGSGIHMWHAATNNIVTNNTVYDNGDYGIIVGNGDSGGSSAGNHDSYIANNIAVKNHYWGIGECCSSKNAGSNQYINNLIWDNGYTDIRLVSSTGTVTATIVADPLFVNQAGDDFHLQSSSPAVNSGTSTNVPSTDIDGITRPQGAGFDRGAYEQ